MTAIDIAETFIRHARQAEAERPLGIHYQVASALELPFEDEQFNFATAFMSFQDFPNQEQGIREAWRVLKPGGFLQFSITHPCFQTPGSKWIIDESGQRVAMAVSDYFKQDPGRIEEWTFDAAPQDVRAAYPRFRIACFDHTLSEWLNMLLAGGFRLEEFAEPIPNDEVLRQHLEHRSARIVPYFLIVRCRKP